jgi:hypothetical protein
MLGGNADMYQSDEAHEIFVDGRFHLVGAIFSSVAYSNKIHRL